MGAYLLAGGGVGRRSNENGALGNVLGILMVQNLRV